MELKLKNFMQYNEFSHNFCDTLTVIGGGNGSGKSTLLDAIRIAMLGDTGRVNLKKGLKELISDGKSNGSIEFAGNAVDLKTGRFTKGYPFAEYRYCLSPELMIADSAKDVRSWVMRVGNGYLSMDELIAAFTARNASDWLIDMLNDSSSPSDASLKIKDEANYYRRKWREVTSEQYGSQKAQDWKPVKTTKPEIDTDALRERIEELKLLSKSLSDELAWSSQKQTILNKVAPDNRVSEWKDEVARYDALLSEMSGTVYQTCPCCNNPLEVVGGKIVEAKNQGRILHKRKYYAEMIEESERMSQLAAELGEFRSPSVVSDELKNANRLLSEAQESLIAAGTHKDASKIIAEAKDCHERVAECSQAVEMIDSLESAASEQALKRVNAELEYAARLIGLSTAPYMYTDMQLFMGRHYSLLSNGEQWLARLCVAMASCSLIDGGFILMDNSDCLTSEARAKALEALSDYPYPSIIAGVYNSKPDFGDYLLWLETAKQ